MSGLNLVQIYAANPITSNTNTDLIYFVQNNADAAMQWQNFVAPNANAAPLSGISGLGTGVKTALAINVGSVGAPVLFNGAGGTPSSITLTNATGLPPSGLTGLGTGVATALAISVGSAGAFVTFNGALGTPSSGTATNLTGLPLSTGVTGTLPLANGGTNANLTASNGGIFYSTGSAGAILSGTATAGQVLISGANGAPSWSQSPSLSSIKDTNGFASITLTATASAANGFTLTDSATGVAPSIAATGTDSNIILQLNGKGTGGAAILGTSTNDNAAAGYVGEYKSSQVAFASRTSISTATATNLTSVSLTAGDWDVWGNVYFTPTVGLADYAVWISTSSATLPDNSLTAGCAAATGIFIQGATGTTKKFRISVASTTTVYLSSYVDFSSGSCTQCGIIEARRRR